MRPTASFGGKQDLLMRNRPQQSLHLGKAQDRAASQVPRAICGQVLYLLKVMRKRDDGAYAPFADRRKQRHAKRKLCQSSSLQK